MAGGVREREKTALVLAMHYERGRRHSDTIRIDAMMGAGWSVVSSDLGHASTEAHINMDFAGLRAMRRLVRDYPGPRVVALDYFWLQQGYYEARYGENWPEKCAVLLDGFPSLEAIFLPIDAPVGRESSMRKQLRRLGQGMTYIELDADDRANPLTRHTMRVTRQLEALHPGRTHAAQKWRIDGFAMITRAGDTTEAHLLAEELRSSS